MVSDFYKGLAGSEEAYVLHPLNREKLTQKLAEIDSLDNIETVAEFLSLFWFYGESQAYSFLYEHLHGICKKIVDDYASELGPPKPDEEENYTKVQSAQQKSELYRQKVEDFKRYTEHYMALVKKKRSDFRHGDFSFEVDRKFGEGLEDFYAAIDSAREWGYFDAEESQLFPIREGALTGTIRALAGSRMGEISMRHIKVMHQIKAHG